MEFTNKDKKALEKAFLDFTEEELKDFIARCLSERALLIISNSKNDEKKEALLKILEELQNKAIEILNKK